MYSKKTLHYRKVMSDKKIALRYYVLVSLNFWVIIPKSIFSMRENGKEYALKVRSHFLYQQGILPFKLKIYVRDFAA